MQSVQSPGIKLDFLICVSLVAAKMTNAEGGAELHCLIDSSLLPSEVGTVTTAILQMRKLRHKGLMKSCAGSHSQPAIELRGSLPFFLFRSSVL